jgi:hypothetical protein
MRFPSPPLRADGSLASRGSELIAAWCGPPAPPLKPIRSRGTGLLLSMGWKPHPASHTALTCALTCGSNAQWPKPLRQRWLQHVCCISYGCGYTMQKGLQHLYAQVCALGPPVWAGSLYPAASIRKTPST